MNWEYELKDKFDWMQNQDYFLLEDLIKSLLKKQREICAEEFFDNFNLHSCFEETMDTIRNAPEPGGSE